LNDQKIVINLKTQIYNTMKLFNSIILLLCFSASTVYGQWPGAGGQRPGGPGGMGGDPSKMNIGRFYGKVVDEKGDGLGFATVQLVGKKFNPITKTLKDTIYAGQLTEENGDFNMENLPVVGEFTLTIDFMGFAKMEQKVDFGLKMPQGGGAPGQGKPAMPATTGPPNFDKDLGNIKLKPDEKMMAEVVVSAKASATSLALDRKSYKVGTDLTTQGGTAQDAIKNIPSVSVDLDGNVSIRNGAPQIFVDGRPTTMSLDQISADLIESVEVITNPSSKFDAGGGVAGILNIVLKKDKRVGYNGNVRVGGDTNLGSNFGGDINARSGKINVFGSASVNNIRGKSTGTTTRLDLASSPNINQIQTSNNEMKGRFLNARLGSDYFLDNRNTLTLSGNVVRGKFNPEDVNDVTIDQLFTTGKVSNNYTRNSLTDRMFRNLGASAQFKHLFIKPGAEWTGDVSYNNVMFEGGGDFNTLFKSGQKSIQRQFNTGSGDIVTLQTDFINPLSSTLKLEGGVKATIRNNLSDNENSNFLDNAWVARPQLADHFRFDDDIYAAYLQTGYQKGKWGAQVGLRAESSFYKGALTDRDSSFTIIYPVQLFPSIFLTHKINDGDQIQFAYTRRVNRPNFFQTMPFTDYSDSLNLRRGNPNLIPEFTNSLELTYQNIFSAGHNLLVSVYYKQANNLITSYQFNEFNPDLNRNDVITGYTNSNSAYAAGAEITLKNSFGKKVNLSSNINIYQSKVDASNVEENLNVNRLSGFIKENLQISLTKSFSVQINGEYRSKASFTPSSNNNMWGGGPRGGAQNNAQGYTKDVKFVDISMKKTFMKNAASVTLSVQDLFSSRKMGSYTETAFFIQDSERLMNPRQVRLNFSYAFGKMDMSLFKRKNNKVNSEGNDMMGG
jgi:outer membrane receptor protein involved in Fe transport